MSPRNNHSGLGVYNINKGQDVAIPGFDLFSGDAAEGNIKECKNQIYHPITALNSEGPFEFRITTANDEFLHTPFMRLSGGFRILKQDGQAITDRDDVSVVNLAPDSLWRSMVFEIDNVKIEDTSYHYAYKAYFEKVLSQSSAAKETHLRNDFFHPDTPSAMNAHKKDGGNEGYVKRSEFLKNSKILYFNISLALDISGMAKPLPPNTVYSLKLSRNSDAFTLMSEQSLYKIDITELYLEVLKLVPHDNLLGQIEKRFATNPLKYELTRSKILKFSIPRGVYDASQNGLFDRGQLPRFVLICLSTQNGLNGVVSANPFNFQHYSISEICLTKNNVPLPSTPFRPQWDKKNFTRLYRAFFDNLGFYHSACANGITPEMFESGTFLLPWDLTPDRCNGFHKHAPESGSEISLRLYFSKETPEVLSLVSF